MQAHNNTIEEFLSTTKTVFVVPVYQRNYDWQDDNCKQLFSDIIRVIETGREHFLGTICFKMNSSRERSIIDGQQRLTSITILLKAIYDFDDDEDIKSDIKDTYLFNKGHGIDTEFLKYRIHLNKRDDAVYHVLLNTDKKKYDEKLTVSQKNSRVYQNYLLFYMMVSDYVSEGGSVGDILETLCKLTIIALEITEENPQEIFESLNSTGLDLTNVDLLRNYLLMQFDHSIQTDLYEKYWSQIEDSIGVNHMEQFFVDYLIFKKRSDSITINGRRNHITERSLYVAFKDYYLNILRGTNYDKTSECFADLLYCADIYKQFIFTDDIDVDKLTPLAKKLYFLLNINDSSKARSLLLYIFDLRERGKIDDEMRNIVVDGIASMTFRARLCKAKGINRQFAGNVMIRLDEVTDYSKFINHFWQAITVGKGSYAFPTDAEFEDALINKDLYQVLRSRGMKYLLYTLEEYSPFPKGLPSFSDDTLTVEHIMPQKLNAQWKHYLTRESMSQYETSLHRLGNLALTNYNGEMSNKEFKEKKQIYKGSKFYYTTRILEYDKWQVNEIDDRSKKLAEECLKIWTLPKAYQGKKAVSKSLHTLGEDTAQFSFTKPSLLLIGNEEYPLNNWSDFLPALCRHFNAENHEAFLEIAKPETSSAFGIEDDNHKYSENDVFAQITGNVYIRQVMSAASILTTASKVTESFDKAAGADYMENILFSLK